MSVQAYRYCFHRHSGPMQENCVGTPPLLSFRQVVNQVLQLAHFSRGGLSPVQWSWHD
jgi:hypothetical protein